MKQDEYNDLKKKALKKLKESTHLSNVDFSMKSVNELVEINEIYQAELEAQNEDLRLSLLKQEQSSQELELLFDQSPIAMILSNKTMNIERTNYKAKDLFGTRIMSTKNRYLFPIFNQGEVPKFLKWFESREYQEPLEIVLHTIMGKRICQLQMKQWSSKETSFLITIEDIHERVQLMDEYKQLADTIPDMIVRINRLGYIEYVNKRTIEAFTEYTNTKQQHIFELDFFAKQDDTLLKESLSNLQDVKELITFSLIDKRKSYILHLIPEKDGENINTFLLVMEDISLRANSEQMFYQLFQHASDGIILSNQNDGKIVFCNKKVMDLLELQNKDVHRLKMQSVFAYFETDLQYTEHIFTMQECNYNSFEASVSSKEHQTRYLIVNCTLIDIGETTYQQYFLHDVTDRKRLEQQTLQNATVFEHTSEGIMITDLHGSILSVNNAFTTITGYPKDEAIGEKPNILKSKKHDQLFYEKLWQDIKNTGSWSGEIWNRKKDGTIYPEWLAISLIYDKQKKPLQYVAVFSDFTEIKNNQEMLEQLAHYDPLTHLPNRLLLYEQLHFAINTSKRNNAKVAIMFLDLDRFKDINDVYGHSTGDKVLIEVSKRLKKLIRESDTVARIGGDEFVIALYSFNSKNEIEHIANKIISSVCKPITVDSITHIITVSIGVTIYPDDSENIETLLKHADIAMYEAKSLGKNQSVQFSDYMADDAKKNTDMFHMLIDAIKARQFFLNYQPQYDVVKKKIIGFEALLRWKHPSVGIISPDKFISFAEETRQIVTIGKFVIEQVCQDFYQYLDLFKDTKIKIAVNVSSVQLDENFIAYLKSLMHKYPNLAKILKIEITETAAIKQIEVLSRILNQIKILGFKISLDDFGTGYSSLTAIKELKADEIKIDRSFIKDVPGNSDDEELVSSIIALAKVMRKSIIAEGVEEDVTQQFLLERGCNVVQGYWFSKPLLLEDAKKLLIETKHY